ncbi:MFS transporter [Paramicrobacterium chengjingii]|nr:MFS transporter [Microbacterium chengjingii]
MSPGAESTAPEVVAAAPVSRVWLFCFALAWFGFWLLVMLPGQFMVVKLASVIDATNKVTVGSFLIGEMAGVIVIGVPIIGWLCDRTRSRFGRRRTWVLAGFLTATIPFAWVGHQTSVVSVAILLGIVAIGQSAVLVSLSALIADRVPVVQRGRASAAMGVPQVIALAAGMIIVTELIPDVGWSWMVIAVLALLAPLPFVFGFSEPPRPADAPVRSLGLRRGLRRLHGYRDFGWATLSRVLINAGNLVGTTYLLYFLADVLGLADPDGALLVLILVYLAACAVASWAGGILTDRWKARRMLVCVSAALQAAAALVLALLPSWESSLVAAVLLGFGYGLFLSVDQALLTDLLPDETTRARDLGIANSAQHLPIAPIIGWAVLAVSGYSQLYIVAAAVIMLGGVTVLRIRSVR